MPASSDICNQLMEEFRAYLETLTFNQIDPLAAHLGCTAGAVAGLYARGMECRL